jgi:hypothetical protein
VALTVLTLRPNSTSQVGLGSVVGAASAHAALSDGLDTSYVQLSSLCRLDSQVIRVGFATPTLPAGAQVYSVGLRRRILSVVSGNDVPVCNHWFRSVDGIIEVAGQSVPPRKRFFNSLCPTSPVTATWTTESVFSSTSGPGGKPWVVGGNLTGFTYDIGRGDASTTSLLKMSEVFLDITYQQLSTVTVTGPTGTVSSTQPTVTWTYLSPDSQPQQAYRVAIYTAAQVAGLGFAPFVTTPLQTSGVVLAEDLQWTLIGDITDGSYSAYVQATSQWSGVGTFTTAIASTTWTRAAAPASPPPAAVLSSAVFDAANNRVALTFLPGGTTPATTVFTVQASRDGGASWDPIPSLTYIPANGMTPVIGYDEVAPLNVTSQYRVLAYSGSVWVAAQLPSNVLSATPVGNQHWLKSPSNPLLNTVLPVAAPKTSDTGIKITKRRMQGTFQLLSGSSSEVLPFVVSGPTYGDEYEIELIFVAGDENTPMTLYPAVDQLDNAGETLLWQQPDGTQLWVVTGPGASGQDTTENYNTLPGNPTVVQFRRRKLILTQTVAPSFY